MEPLLQTFPYRLLPFRRQIKRMKAENRPQEGKDLEMEAGSLYEQVTAPGNEILGSDDPALAPILTNYAIFKLGKGEAATAHELNERAIELLERYLGPDHLSLVGWLHNHALLLEEQGFFEEANYQHMRILMILENKFGTDHPEFASRLNNRAIVLWRLHEVEEADAEFAMAISIGERTLGEESTDVASWIGNRAIVLAIQGKYDEADELFLRAIGISERSLGVHHLTSALYRANRANLLMKKGEYEGADKLYWSSIKIARDALGSRHPVVVRIRHNSATCKLKQGTTARATEEVIRTIHIGEEVLGAQEVAAWTANFAASRARKGRNRKDHREFLERALERIKGSPWEEYPDHPSRLIGRALMRKHGRSREAESLYVEAIKSGERILGKESPDLAPILNEYADFLLLTHRDRLKEIEELNARAISIAESTPGLVHPRISDFRKTQGYLQKRKARLMAQQPDDGETPDGHMQRDSTPHLRRSSHSSPRAGCFGCGQCFRTNDSR